MSMDKDDELLQLIYQHLHETFPEISEQLRAAACIDDQKIFLRKNLKQNILDGHWSQIIDEIKGLNESNVVNVVIFKILTQKLNEKLFEGDQKGALEILRNEISPLGMFPERMHNLAQNILLSKPDPLGLDRLKLAQDIFSDLKNFPEFLFTENRLDELVGQAKKYQIMNCPYHYDDEQEDFSVWQDHKCARSSSLKLEIYENVLLTEDAELLKISCSPDKTKIIVTDEVTNQYRLIYNFESETPNCVKDSIIENGKEAITVWPQICGLIPRFEGAEFYCEDIYTGSKVKCQVNLGEIIAVAFFTNFQWVVVSTKEQITSLIDCQNGKVIHSWIRLRCKFLLTPQNNKNILRDEDETYKYFLGVKDDGSIVQMSCLTYEILKTIPTINEKFQISSAYLESGRLLIGYTNSTIFYYEDWRNYGQPIRMFRGHTCEQYQINAILSEFERNLVIGCSENGSIYVWNIESSRLIYEIPLHDGKCVNDVLEIEPKTFLSCGDDRRLFQWKLP